MNRETRRQDDADRIVTTLGNRLGFDRMHRFVARESHLPEREYETAEAMNCRSDIEWSGTPRKRPLRLYKRPERLRVLAPRMPPEALRMARRGLQDETRGRTGAPER